ncbi:single-stranded DNA-binding protein [Membranicola marinus]|uniref:Single-stranded DNA-binding protein n=1 Tax=Membranihabitans marinus TaxID=1227546 RepID=A0A953HTM8_9BACT|nr:single-stranded DNA-binding protein [Membranihabitans marinus]MBY5958120.1 single-stranded DNA-binding protein [Membranihabitans marinus]
MINKVILVGNLGKDPEVRVLESGTKVAKFPMATNENYRDKNNEWQTVTEWHNVILWRYLAESAERQLKKGSLVYIEGKLTHRKYQDKDGNDRYVTEVVANIMRSLERRDSQGGGSPFPSEENDPFVAGSSSGSSSGSNASSAPTSSASDSDEEEDDLPF